MKISAFAASDCGRVRSNNEDHYLIDESLGLYIVCDGMGGHSAGEVAAERSVSFAAEFIRARRPILDDAASSPDGYFRVMELAEDATQEVSRQLNELACSESTFAGMGTTMTMMLVVDNKAIMAHVGDSRLYMLRRGETHQLSMDHTLANELLQAGQLTWEQAEASQYNHVLTRTIGQQESVQVESLLFDLIPGDVCLLCSDGLSNYFNSWEEIGEFLKSDDLSLVPAQLVDFANSRGGADNITLIVLRATADAEEIYTSDIQLRIDALQSSFLCKKMSVSRLMRMLNVTTLIECAAGQRVLATGQPCDGLYIVLDGRLTMQDDDVLSRELVRGDCVGDSALLHPSRAHASVFADEPSRLMFIARAEFAKLTRRLPKLGNTLLKNLGEHLSAELDRYRSSDKDQGDTASWGGS